MVICVKLNIQAWVSARLWENHKFAVKLLQVAGLLRRPKPSPAPTPVSCPQWLRARRRGIRARLAANPYKPAIPTIIFANVPSLDNQLGHMRLLCSTQRIAKDYCVFVLTQTWLNDSVLDHAVHLDHLTCYRVDRVLGDEGKTQVGFVFRSTMLGVAMLLWSSNAAQTL